MPTPTPTPCPVVVVSPLLLSNATVGIAYSQTVTAGPGGGAYGFSVTAGALPTGLSLDPTTGLLSGTPTATGTFSFTIQATGPGGCTGSRGYTIVVSSPASLCSQLFDSVEAPELPSSWTSVSLGGMSPWVTSPAKTDMTMPNAAFAGSVPTTGRSEMTTPLFVASAGGAQMTFHNVFNFEADGSNPNVGYDGMVLEISINGGAFQDILAAGGSFVTGGYNKAISTGYGSPIAGRMAWSGLSGGTPSSPAFITTTVNLPSASYGQLVRMRWIVATDNKSSADGDSGAWIDTIIGVSCSTTAAGVEVSGRGLTADGRGLRNAVVSISDASGVVRLVTTSSFGYYRFDDVEAGRTYVVSVGSRRYRFSSRVIQVMDTLAEVNFVGLD